VCPGFIRRAQNGFVGSNRNVRPKCVNSQRTEETGLARGFVVSALRIKTSHHTSGAMTNSSLSPAAEAVLDAANGASSWGADDCLNESRWIAAAALQAAADQVVPETAPPLIGTPFVRWDAMDEIRAQLLVIAAELEAMPND